MDGQLPTFSGSIEGNFSQFIRRHVGKAAVIRIQVGLPLQSGEALVGTLSSEHRLLVKGSRGVAMERILQSLQSET